MGLLFLCLWNCGSTSKLKYPNAKESSGSKVWDPMPKNASDSTKKALNEIIAYSEFTFIKSGSTGPLCNLVADIIQKKASQYLLRNSGFPVHLCVLDHHLLQEQLNADSISLIQALQVFKRNEDLWIIQISGGAMDSLLMKFANNGGEAVSGLNMSYKNNSWTKAEINGLRFDSRKEYWLAVNSSLVANPADYPMLANAKLKINTQIALPNAFANGLKEEFTETRIISPRNGNRIEME